MEGLLTSQQLTALEDILKIILLPPAVCIAVYLVQRWLCRSLWGTKVKLIPSMVLSVFLLSFVCKLWMWQQKKFFTARYAHFLSGHLALERDHWLRCGLGSLSHW